MPPPIKLNLSAEQRAELEGIRDHDARPYMREHAAALLKIDAGHSGMEVARELLNRPHWQDTIYDWVKRYQAEGVKGLEIRKGRGRKPAFSPSLHGGQGSPSGHRASDRAAPGRLRDAPDTLEPQKLAEGL